MLKFKPEVVSHRGANAVAPENTYAAAAKAIEWGVDYVEVDVNVSKDGVHYVIHGPTVDLTTNGRGRIADLTAAEIDALDAGSWFDPAFASERVPRLEPFLRWLKGKAKIYFDLKAVDLPALIALVRELDLVEDSFFWTGDDALARALVAAAPDFALKINVETAAQVAAAVQEYGAKMVEVGLKDLSPSLVAACREHQVRLMVLHAAREEAAFRQILRWGVDLINTDHTDLVLELAQAATNDSDVRAMAPRAKRAILIMLDGCRPEAIAQADAPNIQALQASGAWTHAGQSVMPSISLPCHTSLFYSLPPAVHGITSNTWTGLPVACPSLIDAIAQSGYDTAAFYTWEPLRDMAAPDSLDTVVYRRLSWSHFDEMAELIPKTIVAEQPTFSFVYMEPTDAIGHRYGWMSPAYLDALARVDKVVGSLLTELDAAELLDGTLLVVMADHGGHGHGHGSDRPEDMTVPIIFAGAGIRIGHQIQAPVSLMDIAPTILAALDIPQPAAWQGRVLQEVFA